MTEEQFDKIINAAADHYNVPPVNPPLDEMWAAIETEAFGRRAVATPLRPRMSLVNNPWLRMAAVLVLGVAIGRLSQRTTVVEAPAPEAPVALATNDQADAYQLSTERYLGQVVTLMVSLPTKLQNGRVDSTFVTKASESLTTLRMLMDSPAASNPRLRALFEDLELVLVQVVQMPTGGSASEAKLIRQAMRERDVMPRLLDAVAETPNF